MLVTMKEIMDHANAGNYAVPAPNVGGEREARAAIEAAEESSSPLILDVSARAHPDLPFLGRYLTCLAQQSVIPVAINLDHGNASVDLRLKDPMHAFQAGFTSIMIDRSTWPYEENVAEVKMFTQLAHAVGISVEAELGHVGLGSEYKEDGQKGLTDPVLAERFIEETGIDCLAVAIGTAHGAYAGVPHLDFDRLCAIKEATGGFPLVLHGGSGSGDENLRRACQLGINKLNISNELLRAAAKAVQTADLSGNNAYQLWNILVGAWKERLRFHFTNCGCAGKAWRAAPRGLTPAAAIFFES